MPIEVNIIAPTIKSSILLYPSSVLFTFGDLHRMYEQIVNETIKVSNLKKALAEDRKLIKAVMSDGKPLKSAQGKTRHSVVSTFDEEWYEYYATNHNLSLKI